MKLQTIAAFLIGTGAAISGFADTVTTVNVPTYANSNVQFNPATFPTGTTDGNQNTGIPFDIPLFGGIVGNWSAPLDSPGFQLDVKLDASGARTFYALLSYFWQDRKTILGTVLPLLLMVLVFAVIRNAIMSATHGASGCSGKTAIDQFPHTFREHVTLGSGRLMAAGA